MALMATPLISVAAILLPLMLNVAMQVAVTVSIAYFILFRLLGRDYDAAVASGGFLGFGLASMPVAMATMDEVGRRYGPSPKAFLLITLAGLLLRRPRQCLRRQGLPGAAVVRHRGQP